MLKRSMWSGVLAVLSRPNMKLFVLLTFAAATCACAAPFELKEGDRVLLLGDALLERENTYGLLEARMHEQFPNVKFTVRNLSWSGETPKGWSRASFDNPEKGWERLKEQIAEVKPTVAILGFGMAASLQEMTDRSGDQTLNPDPVRYGAEPMSAGRFKKELGELMDAINASTPDKQPARFILLSPIKHEDLRNVRPGTPDPAPHNALLDQYAKALEALAMERKVVFCPSAPTASPATHNGITLTESGYSSWALDVGKKLEWASTPEKWRQQSLYWPISRKNDLFFHQFRPANSTYLFGFRKHEQGKNAAEMPKFTPLIEKADAEIDKTKRMSKTELALQSGIPPFDGPWSNKDVTLPGPQPKADAADRPELELQLSQGPKYTLGKFETDNLDALSIELKKHAEAAGKKITIKADRTIKYPAFRKVMEIVGTSGFTKIIIPTDKPPTQVQALPLPNFTVADGFELTLWADTGLVGKPVGMNWDAQGRLWVACSPVYPQIEPGAHPHDKVVVLEDSDRDGKADKSTTFASNLLIAAGVAPDFGSTQTSTAGKGRASEETALEQGLLAKVDPNKVAENNLKKAAEPDPQEMFVEAFLLVRKAEEKEAAGDQPAALQMYRQAAEKFGKIKTQWPKWQPTILDFRLKRTNEAIERLTGKKEGRKNDEAAPALLQATPSTPASAPSISPVTAAYVGSSTELVRVEDTDGDGIGDQRRIVLSGFGTEDTHHTIHTLRWGPDGKLYFNQSIYIHSHMETPWGMVRLNSGGICAYDPRTERVEVFARGFINTWGHAWDQWGQSFATDGAGFEGVHWIIPGAMYRTYEGARRILPSISPGTYPKYCGLELIQSPLFPEDWQGNAITCDFRAHKITRFQINDLSQPTEPGKEPLSGYVTKELPNPVVTSDASFRPIDVKLGPDGALYIADWTNPIINHGEVDFRDPRRDHTNGRIWRLAPKGKAALKWEAVQDAQGNETLFERSISGNAWESQQATQMLHESVSRWRGFKGAPDPNESSRNALTKAGIDEDEANRRAPGPDSFFNTVLNSAEQFQLAANRFQKHRNLEGSGLDEQLRDAKDSRVRAGYARLVAEWYDYAGGLETFIKDPNPRVRVAAMRGLVQKQSFHARVNPRDLATFRNQAVTLILEAAMKVPGGAAKSTKSEDKGTNQFNQPTFSDTADPFYGYAAWLSINDLDDVFLKALSEGAWKPDTAAKQQQLAWALGAIRPEKAGKGLSDFIAKNGLPKDGSGPWIELIGQAGGIKELQLVFDGLLANTVPEQNSGPLADKKYAFTNSDANRRAAAALLAAAKRGVKPAIPPNGGTGMFIYAPNEALDDLIRVAGYWKFRVAQACMFHLSREIPASRMDAIFESFRTLANDDSAYHLTTLLSPSLAKDPYAEHRDALKFAHPGIRRRALGSLAAFRPDVALTFLRPVLEETDSKAQLALWRELFSSEPFAKAIVAKLPDLTKEQAAPALRAARELGKRGEKLVAAFTPLAGETAVADVPVNVNALVDMTKKNGNPAEGELIYRRAALTCTVCHAIGGAGGKVGPDLGTIGASAPLDYVIESTVNPAVKVKEGFHAVAVTTKDGKTLSGTIAKETDSDMVLRDMTGAEQTVEKSNIKERTNIGSLMPAGLVNTLNDREKANLFAFMAQLGKPGPFDASKSNIARTWRVYSGDLVEQVVANKADPAKGIAVYSLVDGRVTKELLEIPLAVAGSSPTIVAAAKFNTVSAVKSRLHLAGITKAWLDGAPLAIASDPNPVVDLSAGDHTLVIKLDTTAIPAHFRAEVPEARFLTE
jgi:putative heme-binding domain-containing protein